MKPRRHSPSPAMTVAFLALLLGLSGTAIALPGKNKVDSGDIKNNTVRSADIRNGTIVSKDIKKSTRDALKGNRGPQGLPGPQGLSGAPGANGSPGPALESPATGSGLTTIPPGVIISAPPVPAGGAGQYLVTATANIIDNNGAGTDSQVEDACSIEGAGGAAGGTVEVSFDDSPAFIDTEAFAVTDVRTLAVGNVVNLTCTRFFGAAGAAEYQRPKITLARVAP